MKSQEINTAKNIEENKEEEKNGLHAGSVLKNSAGNFIPQINTPTQKTIVRRSKIKAGKTVKANISEVFRMLGGIKAMLDWANAHPTEFYQGIYAKMLPKESDITIDNGNAQRYELPPEETQELRETADRIIKLRLVKGGANESDNTTGSICMDKKVILSDV